MKLLFKNYIMDTIKINILEVAAELAHKKVEELYLRDVIGQIYEDDNEINYTEEAQDIFNEYYEEFYDFLWNLKQTEV